MKINIGIGLLFLAIFTFSSFTTSTDVLNPMVGSWDYEVPGAPYEYQKGEMTIAQNEDLLTAKLNVGGYMINAESLKVEDKNLKFHLYVEGTKVNFDLNFEPKAFSGKVTYSEGTIDIKGKKKE